MRLALGMMITAGEAPFIPLHLYPVAHCFDGFVFGYDPDENVDAELESLRDFSLSERSLVQRKFDHNWSAQFNAVIEQAEHLGYEAILRLDPDETMFADDILKIRELLEIYPFLYLSRVNYWMDRLHYAPEMYPDYQARAWLLHRGLRLGGKHHEGIVWPAHSSPKSLCTPDVTIHHYGDVGRERILKRDLHYLNVAREKADLPPLAERPSDREFPTRHNVPYNGQQPLDPNIIGLYAPWDG